MPGYDKVGKKTRICATCDNWRSYDRRPVNDNIDIEYEVYQRAECAGSINRQQMMTPLSKCKEWRMWKKMEVKPMSTRKKDEELNLNRIRKAKEYLADSHGVEIKGQIAEEGKKTEG